MNRSIGKEIWFRAAALVIGVLTLVLLWYFARVIAMLFLGVTIAAALAPLVGRLARFIPRAFAIVIVYLAIILVIVALGWVILPPLINQASDLTEYIPTRVDDLQKMLNQVGIFIDRSSLISMLTSQVNRLGSMVLSLPLTILSSLLNFVLLIFISLYSLIEAPRLKNFLCSLFPEERGERVVSVLENMSEAMGGYVRGSILNGLIVGLLTTIGLQIMGVEYPVVLGLLAGLLELIPILGPVIAGAVAVVVTLLQAPGKVLMVLVFFIVLQQLENHILAPNIMRSQTDISPLLTVLAVFAGSLVGGLLGALVAIPLAAAVRVLVHDVAAPLIRTMTGKEQAGE